MKNQEFVSKEYPKACKYCEKGRLSFDRSAVLCNRKGIMKPDDCCKKYTYDPLKREPKPMVISHCAFGAEDFALE